jgi:hypothetical protein
MSKRRTSRNILDRPKIDYLILIIGYLLLASNQLFNASPLQASGTIAISNGSAIPQETNYTLSTLSIPSVTSAILLNESIYERYLSFDVPVENIDRIQCNFTLQSLSENTTVGISFDLGRYETHLTIISGILPATYSFEPNMSEVRFSSDWIASCYIQISANAEMKSQIILMWAEFDTPMSPVVLNWQATDGQGLFENQYTRSIRYFGPELKIERLSDSSIAYFHAAFQNRSVYLEPQNYAFAASWHGYYSWINIDISVLENITSICSIRMKAVRVYLSINPDVPLTHLIISSYSLWDRDTYDLYLQSTEIPEFLYIPPYSSFIIEIASVSLLSRDFYYSDDIIVQGTFLSNSTNNLHIDVTLPFITILGLQITPQDFIQISLAIFLFLLILSRIFLYLHNKKPRISWKDPHLIPIFLIGITAFLPWFTTVRSNLAYFDSPIHVISLGIFPLVASWTESSGTFLSIPSIGLPWAIAALLLFWIPLLYANLATTPPNNLSHSYSGALVLFSPLLFISMVQFGLAELFSFPLEPLNYLQSYFLLIPSVYLICIIVLRISGHYKNGSGNDRLSIDAKTPSQISVEEEAQSQTKLTPVSIEKEARKTLDLVLIILQFLILIIPTTIGFIFQRSGSGYTFDNLYVSNLTDGVAKIFDAQFGLSAGMIWIFITICYYLFSLFFPLDLKMKSRPGLSFIFFFLWASLPIFVLAALNTIHFYYYYIFGIEWTVICLPYCLLSLITIQKIGDYIRGRIKHYSMMMWIIIPAIAIIPGGLLLYWITALKIAATSYWVTSWIPLPIFTIFLILIIWPLKKWIRGINSRQEVKSEIE